MSNRLIKTRFSEMRNRVIFLEEVEKEGPEAGGSSLEEVFSCAAAIEEVSLKDFEVLGLSASKKYITIIVRNNYKAFQPEHHHQFKLRDGLTKNKIFNVKEVSALAGTKETYIKIVGEQAE